jgi:hypothetical protein
MSHTVYEARAKEVWRLVHSDRLPMRKVAARLKVSLTECYELLSAEVARRKTAETRTVATSSLRSRLAP